VFVLAVLIGVTGGLTIRSRSRFGSPRAVALILGAAGLQLLGGRAPEGARPAVVAVSLALACAWLLCQRRHAASVLLAVGAAANTAVIAANGGMPVDSSALASVGRANLDVSNGFLYKHIPLDIGTRLAFLADRIPIPLERNVISIGDAVMAAGIALWVADAVAGWRAARRSSPAVHGEHGRGAEARLLPSRVRP
jgi:hypothetical protein